MSAEPDSLILQLLRDMRAEIGDMRSDMATKTDVADLRSDMTSLRADVAADMIDLRQVIGGGRKDLSEQIVGLRRAVVEYHNFRHRAWHHHQRAGGTPAAGGTAPQPRKS